MKVSVVTLLIIASSANLVWAECAWVLWGQETTSTTIEGIKGMGPSRTVRELWVIETAFPEFGNCNTAKGPRLRQWIDTLSGSGEYEVSLNREGARAVKQRKLGGTSSDSSSSSVKTLEMLGIESAVEKTVILMEYKCLPDTLDPRRK